MFMCGKVSQEKFVRLTGNHKYQWKPPVSLDEVESFEHEIGIELPTDYRNRIALTRTLQKGGRRTRTRGYYIGENPQKQITEVQI